VDALGSVLGHGDRLAPFGGYVTGLDGVWADRHAASRWLANAGPSRFRVARLTLPRD